MTISPDSPFFSRKEDRPMPPQGTVHVNFCDVCHYVWKAPAAATQCINCTNPDTARSLASYQTEAPIT